MKNRFFWPCLAYVLMRGPMLMAATGGESPGPTVFPVNSLMAQLLVDSPLKPAKIPGSDIQPGAPLKETQLYTNYRDLQGNYPRLSIDQRRGALQLLLGQARDNPDSPLLPYIYYMIFQNAEPYSSASRAAEQFFTTAVPHQGSCPYFYVMNEQATRTEHFFEQPAQVERYIEKLQHMSNRAVQLRLLQGLLATMDRQLGAVQAAQFKSLAWVSRRFPRLQAAYPWLGVAEPLPTSPVVEPTGVSASVQQATRAGKCKAAKKKLVATIANKNTRPSLEQFVAASEKIDACVRGEGSEARLALWTSLKGPAAKAFGYGGWATLQLRIAKLLWNDEKNSLAKSIAHKLASLSRKKNDRDSEARAEYLEAAILHNENNRPEAIKHLETVMRRFPKHPLSSDVRHTLLMLYAGEKLWPHVFNLAGESLASLQSGSLYFDRTTAAEFYFWQARAAQALGKRKEMERNWQILADSYFGTYYGALGHFLLENSLGKQVPLLPKRQIPFEQQMLVEAFNPVSEGRKKISLILKLLEMGMHDDAGCEISLMSFEASVPAQQLARAFLLHVTDQWLEAVKAYQSLPQEYRENLPIGLEKIFFPKKFATEVVEYSKRLDLDPDFVFSLIRQESVFNPLAQSPVGAKGLMQLMNATAQRESQRLSSSYLSGSEHEELIRKIKFPTSLFDVQTNVMLGVHHLKTLKEQYTHPVLMLAAYNAGPGAANKWYTRMWDDDVLLFIENIPYQETRNYVKYIMRNYFYYKRLYPSKVEEYPLLSFLAPGGKTSPCLSAGTC